VLEALLFEMSSFTVTLTDRSSVLQTNFFPPIELKNGAWEAGLTSFDSYFSIPNLIEGENSTLYLLDGKPHPIHDTSGKFFNIGDLSNVLKAVGAGDITVKKNVDDRIVIKTNTTLFNQFDDSVLLPLGFNKGRILTASQTATYTADHPIKSSWSATLKKEVYGVDLPKGKQHFLYTGLVYVVPTGTYELDDLNGLLTTELKKLGVDFQMQTNLNTLHCGIKCSKRIDFNVPDSFASLLGFKPDADMPPNNWNWSTDIIHVFSVTNIGVALSCCEGDFRNGKPSHVIYQFTPNAEPGYRLSETPETVTYHLVIVDKLDEITAQIVDQAGRLISFRSEEISIRIHFRKVI